MITTTRVKHYIDNMVLICTMYYMSTTHVMIIASFSVAPRVG